MAHVKNIYFEFYSGFNENASESYEAYKFLKQLKTDTGFFFRNLHYGDPSQHTLIFENTKTWYTDGDVNFPFMTYREIYDENDGFKEVQKCVVGLDAIKAVDWKTLEDFKG